MKIRLKFYFAMLLAFARTGAWCNTDTVNGITWTYTINNSVATITTVSATVSGELTVPSSLGGCPVEVIGSYAFTGCTNLTMITFPSTVKTVEKRALDCCTGLKQVNFGVGLESLDNSAFRYAKNIICVVFAGNAPTVDAACFKKDSPNFTVIAKPSTTGWDDDGDGCWEGQRIVYKEFTQYPTLDLSRDLRTETVNGVTWTYTINNGVATVAEALAVAPYIPTVPQTTSGALIVPPSLGGCPVEIIESYAFTGCSKLTSITFPSTLRTVETRALDYCTGLKEVYFSAGLEYLDNSTFRFASGITNVIFAGNAPYVDREKGKGTAVAFREDTPDFTVTVNSKTSGWDDDGDGYWLGHKLVYEDLKHQYLVIDISQGPSATVYPVYYLSHLPENGWAYECATSKIVLKRCPAGPDPLGQYVLTKDIYVGIFEITQRQWQLVTGKTISGVETLPMVNVSPGDMRGFDTYDSMFRWYSDEASGDSFIGRLRTRTGIKGIALPTNAQWCYCCRAGSSSTYVFGETSSAVSAYAWTDGSLHDVGCKLPNAFGLYDMYGNAAEWVCQTNGGKAPTGTDPSGYGSGRLGFYYYTPTSTGVGWQANQNAGLRISLDVAAGAVLPLPQIVTAKFVIGEHGVRTSAGQLEQQVLSGGSITEPAVQANVNWEFDGWYLLPDGGELITVPETITEDMTFYAHWVKKDPIPEVKDDATSDQVAVALKGSADGKLAECITNAASYKAYREWAESVKGTNGTGMAGAQAVKESPNAWVSFALGSDKLLESAPTDEDLTVEEFEPSSEAGKFDFTVSVEGVEVGSDAQKENLKQVFGLEGAATLDPNAFSSGNVDLTFDTPKDGKVKFTAGPKDGEAKTFFMKVRVNP